MVKKEVIVREQKERNYWQKLFRSRVKAQMATLLTLAMALVLAFTAVTVNVGRTALRKTKFSNAADGAAINIASQVGSWAHYLSETYLDGESSLEFSVWGDFWKALAFIVQIAIGFVWPVFFVTAAVTAVGMGVDYAIEGDQIQSMNRELAKMSKKQAFTEGAILYAMLTLVDDQAMEVDVNDVDEDGQVTDKVSSFYRVIRERQRALTIASEDDPGAAKISYYFLLWQMANTFISNSLNNAYYNAIDAVNFLRNEFIPFMKDLEACGPPFDAPWWEDGEPDPLQPPPDVAEDWLTWEEQVIDWGNDEVDETVKDLERFIYFYQITFLDSGPGYWVRLLEFWLNDFFDPDNGSGWATVFFNMSVRVAQWRLWLNQRLNNDCPNRYGVGMCDLTDEDPPVYNPIRYTDCDRSCPAAQHCCCGPMRQMESDAMLDKLDDLSFAWEDLSDEIMDLVNMFAAVLAQERTMVYVWKDSVEFHVAGVYVNDFKVPKVSMDKGFGSMAVELKPSSGNLGLHLFRIDIPKLQLPDDFDDTWDAWMSLFQSFQFVELLQEIGDWIAIRDNGNRIVVFYNYVEGHYNYKDQHAICLQKALGGYALFLEFINNLGN